MTDEDRLRRRAAKLVNERLKLIAGFCNTLGVATFVTLVLAPAANGHVASTSEGSLALLLALALHGTGHIWLWSWRSED